MGDILKDFSKPFVVACIPAFNEERSIARVIVRVIGHVDRFLVCDGGARSLGEKPLLCNVPDSA